jgi:hypothetical protein
MPCAHERIPAAVQATPAATAQRPKDFLIIITTASSSRTRPSASALARRVPDGGERGAHGFALKS